MEKAARKGGERRSVGDTQRGKKAPEPECRLFSFCPPKVQVGLRGDCASFLSLPIFNLQKTSFDFFDISFGLADADARINRRNVIAACETGARTTVFILQDSKLLPKVITFKSHRA